MCYNTVKSFNRPAKRSSSEFISPSLTTLLLSPFQVLTWSNCWLPNPEPLDPCNYGWRKGSTNFEPIWFIGHQLPPAIRRSKPAKISKSQGVSAPPTKKKKMTASSSKQPQHENIEQIDETSRSANKIIKEMLSMPEISSSTDTNISSSQSELNYHYQISTSDDSEWEVDDFTSSDESGDMWEP